MEHSLKPTSALSKNNLGVEGFGFPVMRSFLRITGEVCLPPVQQR